MLQSCNFCYYLKLPLWSNGLMVKVLDAQSRGPLSKPLGGFKVSSAFHPSEVDHLSTRKSWELNGKK